MCTSDRLPLTAALAAAAVVLAACTSAVKIPEPNPPSKAVEPCRALHRALPEELAGNDRRPTVPQSRLLAAWGSPPVALRCGVGRPVALRPTSRLATVNGVDWLPEPADAPVRFTTIGRGTYVQVILPDNGAPAANVLVELAAPIKATLPESR